jgi:hypothetical protein
MPGVVAGPVTTPWAGTSGNRVVSLQRVGQYQRSYWIPRSSTPALSEKHNSLVRLLNNKGFREESMTKVGLNALGKTATLESNKSPHGEKIDTFRR